MGQLYYGDNLQVMRDHLKDESVDLIYLDPPFNSKRDYNLLFKSPKGEAADASITAFEDTWTWGQQSEFEFKQILIQTNTQVADLMLAIRKFLGENDMMAYLTAMAVRLLEMHRVLKDTGTLYLHCDPTASHYLKLVLDAVMGKDCFRNEIVWRRSHPKGLAFTRFATNHDSILAYSKLRTKTKWNPVYRDYDEAQVQQQYSLMDPDGRRYQLTSLLNPNPNRPNLTYKFKGVTRVWRWTKERMAEADAAGLIVVPKGGQGIPRYKRYLDEQEGIPVSDFWDDIELASGGESLGYPTQKPLALLERIILASTDPDDVVLDPFCGCGTAVHAAQKLKRKWIGIDITHLAIALIEKRMRDAFKDEVKFEVFGTPRDIDSARDLALRDRYQFQWWATSLVNAQPFQGKKKGADGGIDGVKFFHDIDQHGARKIIVSVKSGKLKPDDVRALNHVREKDGAEFGLLICLHPPSKQMLADAASAGVYTDGNGKDYMRIQILDVEALLSGSKQAQHPDFMPDMNFKKAKREVKKGQEKLF